MTEKHAPTKEGWYQLANGIIGYLKGPDKKSDWRISLNPGNAIYFRKTGEIITKNIVGDKEGWQIVKYLGDVLPWEALISEEEANIELRSENEEIAEVVDNLRSDYKSLLEACESDRQARLKLVEECERLKRELAESEQGNCELRKVVENHQQYIGRNQPPSKSEYHILKQQYDVVFQSRINLQGECEKLRNERDEARKECEKLKEQLQVLPDNWSQRSAWGNVWELLITYGLNDDFPDGVSAMEWAIRFIQNLKQQRDQYESELRAAEELFRKWSLIYDATKDECEQKIKQLEAERDEWKRAAERLKSERNARQTDNEDLRTRNVNLQGHYTKRLNDLQERVAKLEEMQVPPPMNRETDSKVFSSHDSESVNQAPDTEEVPTFKVGDVVFYELGKMRGVFIVKAVDMQNGYLDNEHGEALEINYCRHATPTEKQKFYADNPTEHPAYKPEHGDMAGWRYLDVGQDIIPHEDEWWHDKLKRWLATDSDDSGPVLVYSSAIRRRVQAEKEVAQ